MLGALLRLVGIDLQRQVANLRAQAEDFKHRSVAEIQRQVADTSITIGFAVVGLAFGLMTVIAGLAALYLWVGLQKGPFAALAAVGLTTAALAGLMLVIVVARGDGSVPVRAKVVPLTSPPPHLRRSSAVPADSFVDAVTYNLADRTAAATHEALDSAAEIVRRSPREVILATVAVAAVVGIFVGRRR